MREWLRGRLSRPGTAAPPAMPTIGSPIGDLEGPTAMVDEHGRVEAIDGSWWLEWGVGTDDRWRVAHRETAVRQQRIDDAPAYETWMRVPGGDVIERVAALNDGVGRSLVVEFENASRSAVAVALVGRVRGAAAIHADADAVSIDGIEWIRGARPAGGVHAGRGDVWAAVEAGPDAARAEVRADADGAVALVLSLPHRQRVHLLVSLEGEMPTRAAMPEAVAAGWRAVTADALTIEVPDADVGEAWRRILPDLVVQAGSPDPGAAAEAACVLDVAGASTEADRARAMVVAAAEAGRLTGSDAVAALRALASRELIAARASGLDELAGPLAEAAGGALDAVTLDDVARALDRSAPAAATDARRLRDRSTDAGPHVPRTAPAVAAQRILDMVIDATDPARIDLLPDVPDSWWGQGVDVRGATTAAGQVSFSVRWHGERPALLWERVGGPDQVELRCPGLDRQWSTTQRTGEALLAAPV